MASVIDKARKPMINWDLLEEFMGNIHPDAMIFDGHYRYTHNGNIGAS